ncbi:VOC family protein [Winogradskyella sp.]|uniref:VOC family protein n=1 Tax=Winogradskyella sp. TaxID=1883156 RepID=UPI003518D48A
MSQFIFNHIALSVKDVNAAVEFYQKVFQLKEIENTASDSKTRWLTFGKGIQLHLIPRPNAEIKINKAVHFAISTDDIDAFIVHLIDLQIDFSDWVDSPNKDYIRKDGVKQVYFKDIDGYWVEVNDSN